MIENTPSPPRVKGRPPVGDANKKTKNRYSYNIADSKLAALNVHPWDFPVWLNNLVDSQLPDNKVEQGK